MAGDACPWVIWGAGRSIGGPSRSRCGLKGHADLPANPNQGGRRPVSSGAYFPRPGSGSLSLDVSSLDDIAAPIVSPRPRPPESLIILSTTGTCSPHRAHKYCIYINTDLQVQESPSKGSRPRHSRKAIWSGGRHAQHGGGSIMRGPVRATMHARAEPALQRDCSVPLMTRCGILCGVPRRRKMWAACVGRPRCDNACAARLTLGAFHTPRTAMAKSMRSLI